MATLTVVRRPRCSIRIHLPVCSADWRCLGGCSCRANRAAVVLKEQWLQAREWRAGLPEAAFLSRTTQAAQAGLWTPRLAILVPARTGKLVGLIASQLLLFCASGTTLSLLSCWVGTWSRWARHGVAEGNPVDTLASDAVVKPPAVPFTVNVAVKALADASACWRPMEWAGCIVLANGAAGSWLHDWMLAVGSRAGHKRADLVAVQASTMATLISPHASIVSRT